MSSPFSYDPLLDLPVDEDDPAQQSLRDRQLRTLFEMALDGIAIADDEGRYLDVNPAACELLGLERDELLGRCIVEFSEPGFDFQQVWQEFQQQEKVRGEFRLVRADGDIRIVEYAATANFLPHRHLAVMRDITARKRAEAKVQELTQQLDRQVCEPVSELEQTQAQLRKSQQRLESILSSIEGVVWSIHPETFETIYINPAVEEIFNCSIAEFFANPNLWFEIIHPDDRSSIAQAFARLKDKGKTRTEYRIVRRDGQVRWLSVNSYLVYDETGKPIRIDGISTDITDRIESESRLEQIARHIPGAIYQFRQRSDGTFHFPYSSEGMREIYGISPEEVREDAKKVFGVIHPDDFDRVSQSILESAEHLTPWYGEYRTCLPDGRMLWLVGNATPQREPDGSTLWHGYVRDISDRKNREIALRESETKFSTIFHTSPDPAWIATLTEGRCLNVNESLCQFLGVTYKDIIGKTCLEIELWDDLEDLHHFRETLLEKGSIQNFEVVIRTSSRQAKTVLISATVERLDGQDCVIGMIKDISDRKQAEMELAASQSELMALFNAMQDVIIVLNAEGRYLKIAPSSAPLLYKPPQEVLGKTLHELLPKDIADWFLNVVRQAMINQSLTQLEYSLPIGDRLVWFDARISPMSEERVVLVARDISDRKRQEQALRLIVEGTAAKTGEDFFKSCVQYLAQVLEVRYAFIAEFVNSEKAIAKTLAFWAGDDFGNNFTYNLVGAPCQNVCLQGDLCLYPNSVQSLFPEDDDLVALQAESYAGLPIIDAAGNHFGLLAVLDTKPMLQNIEMQSAILRIFATRAGAEMERIQAEAAVRRSEIQLRLQSEELETTLKKLQNTQTQLIQAEKMSSLGQLVAGIAHEINNPVSFIYGNLQPAADYASHLIELIQLYQEHYPSPPQAISDFTEDIDLEYLVSDFSKLLESMKTGATRISDIVKSLRTFSRLDESDLKEIDIHENIESTLIILQNRLNSSTEKTKISAIKNYGNLPLIECYGSLLNQVFLNLLVNAIDAIEQRRNSLELSERSDYLGWIAITTSIPCENKVLISIQDNGCGMSPQVKEKIFNPFFTTKPVGKGTGMGLATSYQIVTENHGGNLQCFSTPGEGTEFVIELPIRQQK